MPIQRRKMVENRTANTKFVLDSMVKNGPKAAASSSPVLGLGEETTLELISGLENTLRASMTEGLKHEQAYLLEKADDLPLRAERNERREVLLKTVIETRGTLSLYLGREALKEYGLTEDPHSIYGAKLVSYCLDAAKLLHSNPREIKGIGGTMHADALAQALEENAMLLNESLEALIGEERELDSAYIAREQAMAKWQKNYVHITSIFYNLLALSGLDELAERLRPSQKQASGAEKIEDSSSSDEES